MKGKYPWIGENWEPIRAYLERQLTDRYLPPPKEAVEISFLGPVKYYLAP